MVQTYTGKTARHDDDAADQAQPAGPHHGAGGRARVPARPATAAADPAGAGRRRVLTGGPARPYPERSHRPLVTPPVARVRSKVPLRWATRAGERSAVTCAGSGLRCPTPRASAPGRFSSPGAGRSAGQHESGRRPMARSDKAATVAELTDRFRESGAAVLTEYRGLTVAQLTELRRAISTNATYAVVKNTLTELAAKEAGVTAFDGQLAGPTAIAFITGDAVETAKGLRDFAKAHPAARHQERLPRREAALGRRDHQARGPGVARGPAGQAGRGDERLAQQGRLPLRRTAVADGASRRGAARAARAGDRADTTTTPFGSREPALPRTDRKETPPWRSWAPTSCSTRSRR